MFARKVSLLLKPGSVAKFSLLMETEVIPKLRKQNGFQDEVTFLTPGRDAVFGISFWEKAEHGRSLQSRHLSSGFEDSVRPD